ncbi:unnamed protein product [Caenorhabditis auriculariae]|uniref:U2A'/phosphoprotein 32 family A C-terminal domain-containing protein n=1 Tax=Caenorhabditis auriculariae TaxID=2777116 RepID=A0A8S1HW20_9PELO|nr:unnamed protein product [Caenorhabditis auriculariae]
MFKINSFLAILLLSMVVFIVEATPNRSCFWCWDNFFGSGPTKRLSGKTRTQINIDTDIEYVEIDPQAKHVDLTRHRLKKIEDYSWLKQVEHLSLRWNLIKKIENLDPLTTLTYLELYDNQVRRKDKFSKRFFFVHNRLEKIENLEALTELEYLELGDNRIKKIENLECNTKIVRLFLGANQITRIENLGHLKKMEVLSLPANGIQIIENLSGLTSMRELYLTQNGIQYINGLGDAFALEILDLNQNRLVKVDNLKHLTRLTDFWARNNQLKDWTLFDELSELAQLNTVYLDFNPIAESDNYRGKVLRLLPQITRLDGSMCRQESLLRHPPQTQKERENAASDENLVTGIERIEFSDAEEDEAVDAN